jgi:hypothetical protein
MTQNGEPVAGAEPDTPKTDQSQAQSALQRIRDRAQQLAPAKFDWAEIKVLRDEGRP